MFTFDFQSILTMSITRVRRRLERFYDKLGGESIAYFPKHCFPEDILNTLEIRRWYIRFVKNVRQEIEQNKYNPNWLNVLRNFFELVQQKKLSWSLFNSGLDIIQKSMHQSIAEKSPVETTVPEVLSDWIIFAKKQEMDEGCVLQQFRIAFYKSLLQVTDNKISPQEWWKNLLAYKDHLPKKISKEIFPLLEDFYERYFSWVEQHRYTVYVVPALAYENFFNAIEEKIASYTPAKNTANNSFNIFGMVSSWISGRLASVYQTSISAYHTIKEMPVNAIETVKNFLPNISIGTSISTSIRWCLTHKKKLFLYGLATFSRSVVSAQSTNPFLTVLNGDNTSITIVAIQQNDSNLLYSGVIANTPSGDQDILIGEISANGTSLSAMRLGGNGNDLARDLIRTNDGGFAIAGWTTSVGINYKPFVAKFAGDKSLSWFRGFSGANNDYANSILEANGRIIVIGATNSCGAGASDIFISEVDMNGNLVSITAAGGVGDENAYSSIKTSDGGYVVVGFTASFGGPDICVWKFDANKNLLWTRTLGGTGDDYANSVIERSNGDLLIVGTTYSFGAVGQDIIYIRLNSSGYPVQAKIVGGIGNEAANAVQKTNNETKLIFAGYTTSFDSVRKNFVADLSVLETNSTSLSIETLVGGDINAMQPANGGGYMCVGDSLVARSDTNASFTSNCTTNVSFNVTDVISFITFNFNPNINASPCTSTLFNVSFVSNTVSLNQQNPCVFPISPTASPTTFSAPTVSPTTSSPTALGSTSGTTSDPAVRSSSNNILIPGLVGGIVGGIVLLVCVSGIYYVVVIRKRNSKTEVVVKKMDNTPDNVIEMDNKYQYQSLGLSQEAQSQYKAMVPPSQHEGSQYANSPVGKPLLLQYANSSGITVISEKSDVVPSQYANSPVSKPLLSQYANSSDITVIPEKSDVVPSQYANFSEITPVTQEQYANSPEVVKPPILNQYLAILESTTDNRLSIQNKNTDQSQDSDSKKQKRE